MLAVQSGADVEERMELTMEAVELAPMIAPEQLGAQRERPPPAWLIVLPPSRLRAFRYLELSRTPPASLSLPHLSSLPPQL